MAFITILGSITTAIYPESCFVKTLLINIHTMYLHLGSLVVSIYLIKREVNDKFKTFLNGYNVFIIFAFIAELMNIVIYKSGILNGETFNMFYISPYFISSLPVYDIIQKNTYFSIFLLIYLITIFAGGSIIWFLTKVIKQKTKKLH